MPPLAKTVLGYEQNPTTGPLIGSAAASYGDSKDAGHYLEVLLRQAGECTEPYPLPGNEGQGTVTVTPLSFGSFGDETVALRYSLKGGILPFTVDEVNVRVGPVLFKVTVASAGAGVTVEEQEQLIRTQLKRVEDLVG